MLWKEKLRIGVDIIDSQHKELFDRTEQLLKEVYDNGVAKKRECIDAILFLKNYAVKHFADEEAYQRSIGFEDYAAHKKLHAEFIKKVLEHEKKMLASDFAEKDVREFTGTLIAWLLYHVADSDQKIGKTAKEKQQPKALNKHSEIVHFSVCDVLHKMAGFDVALIKEVELHGDGYDESINIEVGLTGNTTGYITLVYPDEFAKNMLGSMLGFVPAAMTELEISALFEVSNIICGTISGQISNNRGIVCDITIPQIVTRTSIRPDERIALDTGQGVMETEITIEYI